EYHARGLNEEESLFLACRRLGQPHQLAAEFAKADPDAVWRGRVFWFVFGLLVLSFWDILTINTALPYILHHGPVSNLLPDYYLPRWIEGFWLNTPLVAFGFLSAAIWLAGVVFFASGKIQGIRRAFDFMIESRARFIASAAGCVAFLFAYHILLFRSVGASNWTSAGQFLLNNCHLLFLIAIGAWLLPAKSGKRPKLV
ncbi:MAG TPA: hypothetical protein VL970_06660, partial [Candidatus Acidoferrales bacterium]|nr:hypothetical protein [Candidatus Acidoferrales bacterium]